ncbi:hypothetical protein C7M84_017579 [Penaeus vannamei]|uniref:Uncharacterized protein n=1 Tax=Penaeus vannamei TaxID=6689 RepID=A0A423SJR3_PENVA|nr:hypothetical protein C7M84_017579 [Penaeus vannamei]
MQLAMGHYRQEAISTVSLIRAGADPTPVTRSFTGRGYWPRKVALGRGIELSLPCSHARPLSLPLPLPSLLACCLYLPASTSSPHPHSSPFLLSPSFPPSPPLPFLSPLPLPSPLSSPSSPPPPSSSSTPPLSAPASHRPVRISTIQIYARYKMEKKTQLCHQQDAAKCLLSAAARGISSSKLRSKSLRGQTFPSRQPVPRACIPCCPGKTTERMEMLRPNTSLPEFYDSSRACDSGVGSGLSRRDPGPRREASGAGALPASLHTHRRIALISITLRPPLCRDTNLPRRPPHAAKYVCSVSLSLSSLIYVFLCLAWSRSLAASPTLCYYPSLLTRPLSLSMPNSTSVITPPPPLGDSKVGHQEGPEGGREGAARERRPCPSLLSSRAF